MCSLEIFFKDWHESVYFQAVMDVVKETKKERELLKYSTSLKEILIFENISHC
jgi:hypothetical protein